MNKRKVSADEAKRIGDTLAINWDTIDLEEFRRGIEVEFEHGAHGPETNVTNDDVVDRQDRLGAAQGVPGLLHAAGAA